MNTVTTVSASCGIKPRLLNDRDAAAYLSIPLAGLKRLPAGRVRIDGRVRWDRVALDAWLDEQAHLGVPSASDRSEAEAALDQWIKDSGHAARRP